MATETHPSPASTTVDLAGLPEPVVQGIKQLVESLREGLSVGIAAQAKPPRPPLRGRFEYLNLSIPEEDIDEARREAWKNFPREFPESDPS